MTFRKQCAAAVMMIRPVKFGYNEQTATSNVFQQNDVTHPSEIQAKALKEFNAFTSVLRNHDIEVVIFEDNLDPHTPDSIFPNNWVSFHDDGSIILYPMMARNRREERRRDIFDSLSRYFHFRITKVVDFSFYENENKYLEGTGSIVFDYMHQVAYANLSPRTEITILNDLAKILDYQIVPFKAVDKNGQDIYHTNVLMCIGDRFAVICEEAIPSESERKKVRERLESTEHEIIPINYDQLYAFAGNMIQVRNHSDEKFIVLSQTAYNHLSSKQRNLLAAYGHLLPIDISTIEKYGGGSVRCMIASIHLPKSKSKVSIKK